MARPNPYSHGTLGAVLLVLAIGFAARVQGGLVESLVHIAMAIVGMFILLYVAYWDPPPPELRARRLQLVVMVILGSTMVMT